MKSIKISWCVNDFFFSRENIQWIVICKIHYIFIYNSLTEKKLGMSFNSSKFRGESFELRFFAIRNFRDSAKKKLNKIVARLENTIFVFNKS